MSIIVANWKMNLSLSQAHNFCDFLINYEDNNCISNLIIAPPAIYLGYLSTFFKKINFSAQDITELDSDYGSYTGEISSIMLSSCGVKYSIVGHFECRKYRNHTNEIIKQKIENCFSYNIIPIICIGESSKIRLEGNYVNFLKEQLTHLLPQRKEPIIIAYEPLWAIGNKEALELSQLEEIVNIILDFLAVIKYNEVRFLYGGAVNLDNISDIMNIAGIDGVLIGRASLDAMNLLNLLKKRI